MSDPLHFPDITDEQLTPLRALRLLAMSHPDLLEHVNCPYTEDQKRVLSQLIFGSGGGKVEEVDNPYDANRATFLDGEGDREDIMARQIALALEDIQKMQGNLTRLDQKDQIAFLKAKPGLIEKLVEMNEKNRSQRATGEFMRKIYHFIEEDLSVDQRTSLIKKIGAFIGLEE